MKLKRIKKYLNLSLKSHNNMIKVKQTSKYNSFSVLRPIKNIYNG